MSTVGWLLAIVALSAKLTIAQGTPAPAGDASLYRASLENVAAWALIGLTGAPPIIEIDPRILPANGKGLPSAGSDRHPAGVLAGAAVPGKLLVMTPERATQCAGLGVRTCRTEGLFIGLTFGVAAVTGDSATVDVFARVSRMPTAEDKARAQRAPNPEVALRRLGDEAGGATLLRLTLSKQNGVWSVINRKIIGQT